MEISGLVHVSSFHAHLQKPLKEKLDENRPLIESYNHPPYNYSKAMGEKIVLNAMKEGLKAIIMTPAGMIGPYDYQPSHFGTTIVNMATQKMPFIVNAGLNWVDTRDVSEAMIQAVNRRRFGEKYIVSGHWQSLKTIASQISSFMGNKSSQIIFPLSFAKNIAYLIEPFNKMRYKRPLFTPIALKELESNPYLDYSKASKELDYLPRPFSTTIVDTLKWFSSAGYI
jgi:dihydroflavonol-4-reductase